MALAVSVGHYECPLLGVARILKWKCLSYHISFSKLRGTIKVCSSAQSPNHYSLPPLSCSANNKATLSKVVSLEPSCQGVTLRF